MNTATHPLVKHSKFLKFVRNYNFQKKYMQDKSGYWYEKKVKTIKGHFVFILDGMPSGLHGLAYEYESNHTDIITTTKWQKIAKLYIKATF